MNRVAAVAAFLLGISGVRASLDPAMWADIPLAGTNAGNQVWHLWPDEAKNPRVLAKGVSQQASVSRAFLTGGPPAWTLGSNATAGSINKLGAFVYRDSGNAFLVAPHAVNTTLTLKCLSFVNGNAATAVVDSASTTSFGTPGTTVDWKKYGTISAALDGDNNLHVVYVRNAGTTTETLCYTRRTVSGTWGPVVAGSFQGSQPGSRIRSTAVIPSSLNSANIYFTFDTGTPISLIRMNTVLNGSSLVMTTFTVLDPSGIAETLHGMRYNGVDRLFFFKSNSLRRWNGSSSTEVRPAVANAQPRSIQTAVSPKDGKQRIAWYNGTSKKFHYLRPNPALPGDAGYTDAQPVQLSSNGGLLQADLKGLHFDADGLPYLLYTRTWDEGFISYPDIPDETLDNNGNGRIDLLDTAFGSNTAGPKAVPVPDTASSFQIAFPTIGTATANPTGGLQTASANLKYTVELSPDLITWTPVTSTSAISYAFTPATGANRTATATITGPAGAFTARFARVAVTRLNPPAYPY